MLAIEDTHWIDTASLDLLETLARSARHWPLMIVVTFRGSDLVDTHMTRVKTLPNYEQVQLCELLPDYAREMLRARFNASGLSTITPDLFERVLTRSQGNPFFIEEMVHLIRDTVIDPSDPQCLDVKLPESLHTLILSRLDQISERQRITLKTASIIGRSFRFAWLYGYYPALGDTEPLLADLDDLCRLNITLLEQPKPNLTYLFKHIVTQEVTYESLPYSQRTSLHEKFADYLETLNPVRYVDLLAYHYHHSANIVKKRKYLRLAGENAAARYANVEAIQYFSSALAATPEEQLLERFQLLRAREEVYALRGDRDSQLRDLTDMETLAQRLDDTGRQAQVALRQSTYYGETGNHDEAITAAYRATLLADASGNKEVMAAAFLEWGKAHWRQAEYADAEEALQRALTIAADFPCLQAYCLRNLAIVAIRLGSYQVGREFYERSQVVFRQIGDRLGEALVLKDLGNIAFLLGDWTGARAYYEQALPLFQQIGQRLGESDVLNNLAIVADDQGDIESAVKFLKQSLNIKREIDDKRGQGSVLINLGEFSTRQGSYDDSRAYYMEALDRIRDTNSRLDEGLALHNLGMVAHFIGDYVTARDRYEQSLISKRETGDKAGESETLAYLGLLCNHLGNNEAAVKYCQEAIVIAQDADAGIEQACALIHLGLKDLAAAAAAYQQALELRQKLGQHHRAIEAMAGIAQVASAQNDLPTALDYVNQILNHLEAKSSDGFDEPIRVHLTCYEILKDAEDARCYDVLNKASRSLSSRAANLTNEAERQTYLEDVPHHRKLMGYVHSSAVSTMS